MGSESGTIAPTGTGVTMPPAPVTPPKAAPVGSGVHGTDNKVSATASVGFSERCRRRQPDHQHYLHFRGRPVAHGLLGVRQLGHAARGLERAEQSDLRDCRTRQRLRSNPHLRAHCDRNRHVDSRLCVRRQRGIAPDAGSLPDAELCVDGGKQCRSLRCRPAGEVDAAIGGSKQSVTVTFTTDDGNAATALSVTNLAALPAGWSSTAAGLSCAVVSTGSGCELPLVFSPTAASNGTLTLELLLRRWIRRRAQRRAQHSLRHDHQRHGGRQRVSNRRGQRREHGRRAVGGRHVHHGGWQHRRRP